MSAPTRIAELLSSLMGLPANRMATLPTASEETNAGGVEMPAFSEETEVKPVALTHVRHPDGRMSSYPPPERWDDWTEWDSRAWPKKVARRFSLIPTICFNCESGCGLLAYVDKKTFEIKKFEGNPVPRDLRPTIRSTTRNEFFTR
jgi:anaerobic selenocysteine-containing dehydrogenase